MTDTFTAEKRSQIMRAVRGVNTTPELIVRRAVFAMGYRYRLHAPELPGKPDIVFRPRKRVIFVHGCFWHQHRCPRGNRQPKTRREYWDKKLARNVARDRRNRRQLNKDGWKVLVVWECQTKDLEKLGRRLKRFLDA